MVTQSTPADQASTAPPYVSEWAERTPWETILAGDLSHPWEPCEPGPDYRPRWASPGAQDESLENDSPSGPEATVVISEDGQRLELIGEATPPNWWPVVNNHPVDKLTAYAGIRGMSRARAVGRLGLREDPFGPAYAWFWNRPGLATIRDVADNRGVGRWGLLGSVMVGTLAYISPTVRTMSDKWGEGSLNLYVVVSGGPGTTKSRALNIAEDMVEVTDGPGLPGHHYPVPAWVDIDGSPEGLQADLMTPEPEDDDDTPRLRLSNGTPVHWETAPRVVHHSHEMDAVLKILAKNGSKLESFFAKAWTGTQLSTRRAQTEDIRHIVKHSYRHCMVIAAQDMPTYTFMNWEGTGMNHRFLFLPAIAAPAAERTPGGDRDERVGIPYEVVKENGDFTVDPVVQRLMEADSDTKEAEAWADRRAERYTVEDPFISHRNWIRQRVAAALSVIIDGELAVTPETWELAGVVSDVSDLERAYVDRKVGRKVRADATQREAERLEVRGQAEHHRLETVRDKITAALPEDGSKVSRSALKDNLSAAQKKLWDVAVESLITDEMVEVEKRGAKTWYSRLPA